MRKVLLAIILHIFVCGEVHSQWVCGPNGVSTNPANPVNDEFLPLINDWHPSNGPYHINSILNTGIDWYPSIRQIEELTLRVIDLQEQINK